MKGVAANVAGGTHHAHRAWGSGFTALNDLAITALALQAGVCTTTTEGEDEEEDEDRVERVAVVDLDVHQGDGTAEILSAANARLGGPDNPPFFTFSMRTFSYCLLIAVLQHY